MTDCICGKDGNPLHSTTCPKCHQFLVMRVGDRLQRECLDVFGAAWSNDVAWRFAKAAIEEVRGG